MALSKATVLVASVAALACVVVAVRRLTVKRSEPEELVTLEQVKNLTRRALLRKGYTQAQAELIADVLLHAECGGKAQGLVKVCGKALDQHPQAQPPSVQRSSDVSVLLDGRKTLGIIVMDAAMRLATEKALAKGVAVVGTYNTCSTTGALGYYADKMARAGLVSIVLSQSPELMAPYGASEAILGTNPIAIGVPAAQHEPPIVLDMATSAMSYFGERAVQCGAAHAANDMADVAPAPSACAAAGVVQAAEERRTLPAGVAFDEQGRPTVDARAALTGALRTFDDGPKGSGLAVMFELLAGALVGAAMEDKVAAQNWGNLIIAVDPQLFGSLAACRSRVSTMANRVRNARPASGFRRVLVPGDHALARAQACLSSGTVSMSATVLRGLTAAAQGQSVDSVPTRL